MSEEEQSVADRLGSKTAQGNSRLHNCESCQRAFTREEHLSRHILLTHNKLKPFVCGICARAFSRRDLLLRHAKNLHEGSELAVSRIRKLYKKNGHVQKTTEETKVGQTTEEEQEVENRRKMSVNMLVS